MPWTETTRRHYRRDGLRYASDVTDAEWELIEPFLPKPSALGRPRTTDLRRVVEAILYMTTTGCQWRRDAVELGPSTPSGPGRGGHFAWLCRCRRLAKDFEASLASAVAWVPVAHIRLLIRRLARA